MTEAKLKVLSLRLAAAVGGGLISSLAFPRENISPLIFVSVAMLFASVRNAKPVTALAIGFVGGLAFYLSQIEWLSLYLGPVPWLALSVLEAIIFALGMLCVSVVWRWLDKTLAGEFKLRNLIIAVALSVLWTSREWVSITIPYSDWV